MENSWRDIRERNNAGKSALFEEREEKGGRGREYTTIVAFEVNYKQCKPMAPPTNNTVQLCKQQKSRNPYHKHYYSAAKANKQSLRRFHFPAEANAYAWWVEKQEGQCPAVAAVCPERINRFTAFLHAHSDEYKHP